MNGPLPKPIHDIAQAFEKMAAAVTHFSVAFERASEVAGQSVRDVCITIVAATVLHAALHIVGNRYFSKG